MRRTALYATFIGTVAASLALSLLLFTGVDTIHLTLLLYGYVLTAAIAGLVGYRKRAIEERHGRHPSLREVWHDILKTAARGRRKFKRGDKNRTV